MPESHKPPERPNAGILVFEFLFAGEVVSAVLLHLDVRRGVVRYGLSSVPVTRIGRRLPDWPRALSLRPDLSTQTN